jgi:hypothetical protein
MLNPSLLRVPNHRRQQFHRHDIPPRRSVSNIERNRYLYDAEEDLHFFQSYILTSGD